jgi:hypothetical protein
MHVHNHKTQLPTHMKLCDTFLLMGFLTDYSGRLLSFGSACSLSVCLPFGSMLTCRNCSDYLLLPTDLYWMWRGASIEPFLLFLSEELSLTILSLCRPLSFFCCLVTSLRMMWSFLPLLRPSHWMQSSSMFMTLKERLLQCWQSCPWPILTSLLSCSSRYNYLSVCPFVELANSLLCSLLLHFRQTMHATMTRASAAKHARAMYIHILAARMVRRLLLLVETV